VLIAYDGLVTDISERERAKQGLVRANQALRESEELLKRELADRTRAKKEWEVTFDAISNPLFIHDREWRIIRANRAYCAAAGVPFPELIGQPYYTIFPKMSAPFQGCERTTTGEKPMSAPDGEELAVPEMNKVFRSRSYPVHDDNGDYLYSVHILEDITEMKRAEEDIRQEMELTANLLMIAETTAYTMDIDTLMEQVARCGVTVFGCDACATYLWDRDRKSFQAAQHYGLDHGLVPLFRTEALDDKFVFIQRMLELKRPITVRYATTTETGCAATMVSPFIAGGETDPAPLATRTAAWMNDDMRILVVIPLVGKTDPLGLIIGIYRSNKIFSDRDRRLVEGLSRQVSLALDEAHSYRTAMERSLELNHKIETLQVIHEIDRGILSSLEPHEILETAINSISRIVPCDNAGVMMVDRNKGGFVRPAGAETEPSLYTPLVPFGDSSATEVIKTTRPQYIGNASVQKNLLPLEKKLLDEGFVSHIRVPLIVKGDPIGVLCVESRRTAAFTPENLSTLEKLAALISVALENTRLVTDMKELLLGTVRSLSNAIDAKSPWTAGHSERVTHYALLIGKELSIRHDELQDLQLGGLLHDVGKIGILDTILNKQGALTGEEYAIVKSHPLWGVELLEPIKQLNRVIPCIRHHHERYDGTGYPDGLKGDNIPFWARILAVADTFDAMTADRPYRKAFEQRKAVEEIRRCTPGQFDPHVVQAFLGVLARNHVADTI
jgi:HD-GYP domain-containing protein (c-di-GMP phosphodiesterase class II)